MPDIQTEMQKILQAWEEPETTEQPKETTVFKPTNNVSKQTFESIRDFSGEPTRFHIDRLVRQGHKKSSVGSLIGQMIRQGRVYKDMDGLLRPNAKEYTPLKTSKAVAKQVKKPKTLKLKTSKPSQEALDAAAEAMGGINMLVDHARTPVYRSKIDAILDDISLSDAYDLYRRLHQYFGGLPK